MTSQHPPQQPPQGPPPGQYGGQPYPPQGYGPPPKKKHTVRNIILGLLLVFILFVGGCLALLGGVANEVDQAIEDSENEVGGVANPVEITEGEAFEVRGFDYAAGWSVRADAIGDIDVRGLKVTNNRDERDSALVEIKLWRGNEVLGLTNCTTEPIAVGTTTRVDCLSGDDMPKNYDRITINDTF